MHRTGQQDVIREVDGGSVYETEYECPGCGAVRWFNEEYSCFTLREPSRRVR
jgi:hypothetical protein